MEPIPGYGNSYTGQASGATLDAPTPGGNRPGHRSQNGLGTERCFWQLRQHEFHHSGRCSGCFETLQGEVLGKMPICGVEAFL